MLKSYKAHGTEGAPPVALPAAELHRVSRSGIGGQVTLSSLRCAVRAKQFGASILIWQQRGHFWHHGSKAQRNHQSEIGLGICGALEEAAGLSPEAVQLLLAQLRFDLLQQRLRFESTLRCRFLQLGIM